MPLFRKTRNAATEESVQTDDGVIEVIKEKAISKQKGMETATQTPTNLPTTPESLSARVRSASGSSSRVSTAPPFLRTNKIFLPHKRDLAQMDDEPPLRTDSAQRSRIRPVPTTVHQQSIRLASRSTSTTSLHTLPLQKEDDSYDKTESIVRHMSRQRRKAQIDDRLAQTVSDGLEQEQGGGQIQSPREPDFALNEPAASEYDASGLTFDPSRKEVVEKPNLNEDIAAIEENMQDLSLDRDRQSPPTAAYDYEDIPSDGTASPVTQMRSLASSQTLSYYQTSLPRSTSDSAMANRQREKIRAGYAEQPRRIYNDLSPRRKNFRSNSREARKYPSVDRSPNRSKNKSYGKPTNRKVLRQPPPMRWKPSTDKPRKFTSDQYLQSDRR